MYKFLGFLVAVILVLFAIGLAEPWLMTIDPTARGLIAFLFGMVAGMVGTQVGAAIDRINK